MSIRLKMLKATNALILAGLLVFAGTASATASAGAAVQVTAAATQMAAALPACPPATTAAATLAASSTPTTVSADLSSAATSAATLSATTSSASSSTAPGYLGVSILRVDDCGARIALIVPGGPASNSKLQVGDVIVAFNGQAFTTIQDLIQWVTSTAPGTVVTLSVQRSATAATAQGLTLPTQPVPDNPNLVQIDVPVTVGALTPSLAMTATKFAASVVATPTATLSDTAVPTLVPSPTDIPTAAATDSGTPAPTQPAGTPAPTAVATQ